MDLAAALALVLVLEGLALAVFARSVPELLSALSDFDGAALRRLGLLVAVAGGALYLLIRG